MIEKAWLKNIQVLQAYLSNQLDLGLGLIITLRRIYRIPEVFSALKNNPIGPPLPILPDISIIKLQALMISAEDV